MEVGKLYVCEEYFLLLYPDPDTASATRALGAGTSKATGRSASYWSNRIGKLVSYAEKNIPLLVLNNKEEYVEVLAGDKKGWIIYEDWLKIREIL